MRKNKWEDACRTAGPGMPPCLMCWVEAAKDASVLDWESSLGISSYASFSMGVWPGCAAHQEGWGN